MNPSPHLKTQRGRLLAALVEARGGWVSLLQILALGIAQYNARIFELRRLGFQIESRVEMNAETGSRHSWFRLVHGEPATTAEPLPQPASPFVEQRRREEAEATPLFARVSA